MVYRVVIPGTLPGLNEYIDICRRNKYAANDLKRKVEDFIGRHIKSQIKAVFELERASVKFTWLVANCRRDPDNVAFAKKFILDALTKSRVLKNDGWNNIIGLTDDFGIDKENPRILVEITPL